MTIDNARLKEVARLFLKLGCFSFGGPAVHIAMMEEEVVRRKKWMDHEHFLDLIGATNLIPGPNSTEMAMHCGKERAGTLGLLTAGFCFITPAVLITCAIAWAYDTYGRLPEVTPFLYGIKPAIISVILTAMSLLARKVIRSVESGIVLIASATACLFGVNDIAVMFLAGLYGIVSIRFRGQINRNAFLPIVSLSGISHLQIFWSFLKIGSILYGSGYVLFAFLDEELVNRGWLSHQQLMDAIAAGQMTPGPVFSAATFVGWQMSGGMGAIAATAGIFLPSFLLVGLLNPLLPKLRSSKSMSSFLDAVNAASIAVIIVVAVVMGKETIMDWKTALIALVSFVAGLTFKKLNTVYIVLGGAIAGYLLTSL